VLQNLGISSFDTHAAMRQDLLPEGTPAPNSQPTGALVAPAHARLRSGTAARLAGVPVSTLRVWERRYAVVAAPKTPTGQRLYSAHDVQRLQLLRLLTDRGHAIGTVAGLDLAALQQMAAVTPAPLPGRQPRIVVVGRSVVQKLQGMGGGAAQLTVFDDLDAAEAASPAGAEEAPPDVLLLHLPSVQPRGAERVLALMRRWQPGSVVLLYAFGPQMLLDSLAAAGLTLRREPVNGRELSRLLLAVPRAGTTDAAAARTPPPPRFTEEALVALAESPPAVACECPRHLAEIVMQLASFERYSAECLSRNPGDELLHRQLGALAGTARGMFEQALASVMAHAVQEGVPAR
jgi:hypothetical protein